MINLGDSPSIQPCFTAAEVEHAAIWFQGNSWLELFSFLQPDYLPPDFLAPANKDNPDNKFYLRRAKEKLQKELKQLEQRLQVPDAGIDHGARRLVLLCRGFTVKAGRSKDTMADVWAYLATVEEDFIFIRFFAAFFPLIGE